MTRRTATTAAFGFLMVLANAIPAAAAEPQAAPLLPPQVSPPQEPLPPPSLPPVSLQSPTNGRANVVPAAAAEPQAKDSGDDAAQLKAAQEERIVVLKKLVEIAIAQYRVGTVDFNQVSSAGMNSAMPNWTPWMSRRRRWPC